MPKEGINNVRIGLLFSHVFLHRVAAATIKAHTHAHLLLEDYTKDYLRMRHDKAYVGNLIVFTTDKILNYLCLMEFSTIKVGRLNLRN
jgi:hypothetical protein